MRGWRHRGPSADHYARASWQHRSASCHHRGASCHDGRACRYGCSGAVGHLRDRLWLRVSTLSPFEFR